MSFCHLLSRTIQIKHTSQEFADIKLRMPDKKILNGINGDTTKMRFPIKGKIKTLDAKVSVLLQCTLSGHVVEEWSLRQDVTQIFSIGIFFMPGDTFLFPTHSATLGSPSNVPLHV